MPQYLAGIDVGTTGGKTCIFDLEGNLIGAAYREYPCYYPKSSWVEQKPEDMVPAIFATAKDAIAKSGIDSADILAVSLSTKAALSV